MPTIHELAKDYVEHSYANGKWDEAPILIVLFGDEFDPDLDSTGVLIALPAPGHPIEQLLALIMAAHEDAIPPSGLPARPVIGVALFFEGYVLGPTLTPEQVADFMASPTSVKDHPASVEAKNVIALDRDGSWSASFYPRGADELIVMPDNGYQEGRIGHALTALLLELSAWTKRQAERDTQHD